MDVGAIIRDMVPGRRWLALAIAVMVAAGVATPLLAQTVTIMQWSLPVGSVSDIALDSTDNVWAQTSGTSGLRKLDPVTNGLTTYTTAGVSHQTAITVDGADKVWSPGTISTVTGAVQVISRLDPVTLELASWPAGFAALTPAVDSLGNVWFANAANIARLEPGTDTVTTWTMPVNVSIGGFDASDRPWFSYNNTGTGEWGLARLDPATNALTTWPAATSPDTVLGPFVDGAGKVWAALTHSVGEDSIIRLDPATDTITEWVCPPGCDRLVAVSVDSAGDVWFTEDGQAIAREAEGTSFIGRLDPAADPPAWSRWAVLCDNVNGGDCGQGTLPGGCFVAIRTNPRTVSLDSTGKVWTHFAGHGLTPGFCTAPALENVTDDIARLAP